MLDCLQSLETISRLVIVYYIPSEEVLHSTESLLDARGAADGNYSSRWNEALPPRYVYYFIHNHLIIKHSFTAYFYTNSTSVKILADEQLLTLQTDVATSEGGKCYFSDRCHWQRLFFFFPPSNLHYYLRKRQQ